jgi:hypothetical protein
MTDQEQNLQADLDRAEHARRLLNDELVSQALAAIKHEVMTAWIDCPQRDKEGKEALWQLAKTADKFENLLRGYIETGKLAAAQLDNLKRFEERSGMARMFGMRG